MAPKPIILQLVQVLFPLKRGPFSAVLAAYQQKDDLEKQIFTQFWQKLLTVKRKSVYYSQ